MPSEADDYELLSAWTLHTLKAYFEAILREQRDAMKVAADEREKAASIVRDSLESQYRAADSSLERHVAEQVQQIRQIITLNEKALEAANAASEKAIQKAEFATEKRFDSVNAFRAQLVDQASTFAPREVVEPRLTAIESWQAKIVGALALLGVFIPLATALVVYLLTRNAIPVTPP